MSGKKSVLDMLVAGSDDDGDEESQDEGWEAEPTAAEAGPSSKKARAQAISLEDLQRAGYNSGPSVLLMKAPQEEQQQAWDWSNGKAAKESEPERETWQERQQTHYAATEGAQETGALALKAAEQAAMLREQRRLEKIEQQQHHKLTFNQKEKRKRDEGKTSRAKNYVEEEKRIGRSLGMYSGFD